MKRDVFVTGTGTGVGKTLLSALLVAVLNRRYWKPIQTGAGEGTDREMVMQWAGVSTASTHPEVFLFDAPVSPHLAAERLNRRIDIKGIRRPADPGPIVIEGAGGVLVPISDDAFMLDLMRQLQSDILIAALSTLGTINHTLLTVSAVRGAGLDLRGVVVIGHENPDNCRAIERYGSVPVVGVIPWLESIDRAVLCDVFEKYFDKASFA